MLIVPEMVVGEGGVTVRTMSSILLPQADDTVSRSVALVTTTTEGFSVLVELIVALPATTLQFVEVGGKVPAVTVPLNVNVALVPREHFVRSGPASTDAPTT